MRDRGVVATRLWGLVLVHGRDALPPHRLLRALGGPDGRLPDASLLGFQWGHVLAAAAAPEVERVVEPDGGRADPGFWKRWPCVRVGCCVLRIGREHAPALGEEALGQIEHVQGAPGSGITTDAGVDGRSRFQLSPVDDQGARFCDGDAVRGPREERGFGEREPVGCRHVGLRVRGDL